MAMMTSATGHTWVAVKCLSGDAYYASIRGLIGALKDVVAGWLPRRETVTEEQAVWHYIPETEEMWFGMVDGTPCDCDRDDPPEGDKKMIFTGYSRVVLVNHCSGRRRDESHHHHITAVEHPAGIKIVLAELTESDGSKTLKIFLSDEEKEK